MLAIDHVQLAMPAGGEGRARSFFESALGMREVDKPDHLKPRGGCWFESGAVRLHLGVDNDFRPARKAHPAFLVPDLASLRARLAEHGIACVEDEPLPGFARVYVADPFGNRIELMERLGE